MSLADSIKFLNVTSPETRRAMALWVGYKTKSWCRGCGLYVCECR